MSGMILLVCAAAVIIIAAAVAGKKSGGKKTEKSGQVKDLKVDAAIKKREPTPENPEFTEAKKELFQYLSQSVKRMFQQYRKGNWERLKKIGVPSEKVWKHYKKIQASLPPHAAALLDDYFMCIDLKGGEETEPGSILDSEGLKKVFLRMTLPFYPTYYDKLDGVRYTALLNQTVLNLFHRLTGKKFRLGYKNRYRNGVTAFRWEGDKFQVYAEDGTLLCNAVFRDGKVWEGYAVLPSEEKSGAGWQLIQEGFFREGTFEDGVLHYVYKKKIR